MAEMFFLQKLLNRGHVVKVFTAALDYTRLLPVYSQNRFVTNVAC